MWWWQTISEIYNGMRVVLVGINRLLAGQAETNARLKRIETLLRQPGRLNFSVIGDDPMLKFELGLPPASAPDVVKGELSVKIGEGEAFTVDTGVGVTVTDDRFAGNDNDPVHAELVYVDDAGNKSSPSILDVVLTDTIPPGQPGELALRVTAEE